MSRCLLDCFPVEILHTIFSYILAHEILLSFSNISPYLDAILLAYSDYRWDFTSILKDDFDLVCQRIRPDQVTSLVLTDGDDTPGQSKLFLSRFQMEQFTRLRSLTMLDVQRDSLETIYLSFNKLDGLCSISLNISSTTDPFCTDYYLYLDDPMSRLNRLPLELIPISRLRHLKITSRIADDFENIFKTGLNLQSLDIYLNHFPSNVESYAQLTHLTRFVLQMDSEYICMFSTSI